MATYKESVGTAVRDVAGEDGVVTGQLWYDTNANEYKYRQQFAGSAWSAAAPTNTDRGLAGGAGIQTAAIIFGGEKTAPSFTVTGETELYNGSSWTEVNDMNTGRQVSAGNAGTQTSALGFGGFDTAASAKTESWNGSSWTEVNDLNTARYYIAGFGADNTAALSAGGIATARVAVVESWNGSSWTEVNDLNADTGQAAGAGIATLGLVFGGENPGTAFFDKTESWNGTSFTEVGDLNNGRHTLAGAGTQPAALAFGGLNTPGRTGQTELWNGTSWSEQNDLSVARNTAAPAGTSTAALASTGVDQTPVFTTNVEEWNANVAIGAWLTGANMNTARYALASANKGTRTSALVFSGGFPNKNETENYNGTAWAEVNNLNTARRAGGGAGTATSALTFGGTVPPTQALTESWNGYTWSEVSDLNTARGALSGVGADNTSALAFGGNSGANVSETWNGSSWSEGNDLNQERDETTGSGIATAALAIGGRSQPSNGPSLALVELYNGTSWTEVGDLNKARNALASGGSSTSAIAMGGRGDPAGAPPPGVHSSSETWNGTSWSNDQDINVARMDTRGAGSSSTNAILMGGRNPATPVNYANTEEWNGTGLVTTTVTTTSD